MHVKNWRIRKRLAVEYQHLFWRFFPEYVRKRAEKRVGHCFHCRVAWLCCVGCKQFDKLEWLCKDYENRPIGCQMFPINRFQTWLMCGDECKLEWIE